MPRILLVYHRPGRPSSISYVERLQAMLRGLGIEAETATIEEAQALRPGRPLFLLMFTRGGHWKSLVDAGHEPLLVPASLFANAAAREAKARWGDCSGLALAALRAKRLHEEQMEDLERIRLLLELHCPGASLHVIDTMGEPGPAEKLVAPLAFLPGRLSRSACGRTSRCLGAFAEYALEDTAAWIADTAWRLATSRQGI